MEKFCWFGFNKLNLYNINEGTHFDDCGSDIRESDFALIRQMGFNFVRFPIDYRFIYDLSTEKFNMERIAWIDHAIDYGKKYGVHIELNIHTAPGYTVVNPSDTSIFTSNKRHFIAIWKFLANRYKEIPNTALDFNLLNEPEPCMCFDNTWFELNPDYASLLRDAINVIRAETPDRLIVLDTNQRRPLNLSLLGIPSDNILQSPHCYAPFSVTHEGMMGHSQFPPNFTNKQLTWPIKNYFNGFLYAGRHSGLLFGVKNTIAAFNNSAGFDAGTVSLTLVGQMQDNELVLLCDGKETARVTAPENTASGTTVAFPWNAVPAGTKKVEIYIASGDWINVDNYVISGLKVDCTNIDWAYPPSKMTVGVETLTNAQSIKNWLFPPLWDKVPAMIGEMGCMAKNASQAAYRARMMKDYVDAFVDLSWAFWEFKGGDMSMFSLSQSEICNTPVKVEYGTGQSQTYYYDKLWYDAIKHRLDFSE
jgi:aryl-phospho-beta-D-glucosidase BglC (GH1 family)